MYFISPGFGKKGVHSMDLPGLAGRLENKLAGMTCPKLYSFMIKMGLVERKVIFTFVSGGLVHVPLPMHIHSALMVTKVYLQPPVYFSSSTTIRFFLIILYNFLLNVLITYQLKVAQTTLPIIYLWIYSPVLCKI